MRQSTHDRIVRGYEKTIARLERELEEAHNKLLFAAGKPYHVPPIEAEQAMVDQMTEPEPEVEHEDPDLPGWTSDPLQVGF